MLKLLKLLSDLGPASLVWLILGVWLLSMAIAFLLGAVVL
jgi:dipeptide/tripeptide permease